MFYSYFSIARHFRKNLLIIVGSIFPKQAFLIILFVLVAEARLFFSAGSSERTSSSKPGRIFIERISRDKCWLDSINKSLK